MKDVSININLYQIWASNILTAFNSWIQVHSLFYSKISKSEHQTNFQYICDIWPQYHNFISSIGLKKEK